MHFQKGIETKAYYCLGKLHKTCIGPHKLQNTCIWPDLQQNSWSLIWWILSVDVRIGVSMIQSPKPRSPTATKSQVMRRRITRLGFEYSSSFTQNLQKASDTVMKASRFATELGSIHKDINVGARLASIRSATMTDRSRPSYGHESQQSTPPTSDGARPTCAMRN